MYPYDFHLVVNDRIVVALDQVYVNGCLSGPLGPDDAVEVVLNETFGDLDFALTRLLPAEVAGEGPGSDEKCRTVSLPLSNEQLRYVLSRASRVRPAEVRIFRKLHRCTPDAEVRIVAHSLGSYEV